MHCYKMMLQACNNHTKALQGIFRVLGKVVFSIHFRAEYNGLKFGVSVKIVLGPVFACMIYINAVSSAMFAGYMCAISPKALCHATQAKVKDFTAWALCFPNVMNLSQKRQKKQKEM